MPSVSENFLYYKGSISWSHGRAKTTGEAELALPRPPLCYSNTGWSTRELEAISNTDTHTHFTMSFE